MKRQSHLEQSRGTIIPETIREASSKDTNFVFNMIRAAAEAFLPHH